MYHTQLLISVLALLPSAFALYVPTQEALNMLPGSFPYYTTDTPIDPCSLAESPRSNASVQLSSWLECQINSFYPFPQNTNWPTAHLKAFSQDVRFTFNDTHYDYAGSLQLYKSFNATLGRAFAPFRHGFINSLGIPNGNGDKGGFVYLIGWAGGFQMRAKKDMYFTNAAFAVIREERGQRKIIEFRESSNIPNTAPLPEQTRWDCHFPKEGISRSGTL